MKLFTSALLALFLAVSSCASEVIKFHDVEAQTRQFMAWEKSIKLTPAQQAVKKAALTALPAPCCSNNSAYTCCCPCNLSLATWGLTNWLIAEKKFTADQVKGKVAEWFSFVNPKGYSGKGCYTGHCPRPFKDDGCGGMNPDKPQF